MPLPKLSLALFALPLTLVISFTLNTPATADTISDSPDVTPTENIPPQSLHVGEHSTSQPLSRDTYGATTTEELAEQAKLKAETAAKKRAAEEKRARQAQEKAEQRTSNPASPPYNGSLPSQTVPSTSIIAAAQQWVGVVPYSMGNTPASGFSCDGFVQYVYSQNGVHLPRGVNSQYAAGVEIPASQAKAGDLLVWKGQHVAIYDGNGGYYHSPTWGRFVEHGTFIWGNPVYVRI